MNLDLRIRPVGLGLAAEPIVGAINAVATGIDGRSARRGQPNAGGLFAKTHVVAEVPR